MGWALSPFWPWRYSGFKSAIHFCSAAVAASCQSSRLSSRTLWSVVYAMVRTLMLVIGFFFVELVAVDSPASGIGWPLLCGAARVEDDSGDRAAQDHVHYPFVDHDEGRRLDQAEEQQSHCPRLIDAEGWSLDTGRDQAQHVERPV